MIHQNWLHRNKTNGHSRHKLGRRPIRFEHLEDRRMLTILLTEDFILGTDLGTISPMGTGARENPYVYDFAGEDLNMAEFDILGEGASFRFENLGMDDNGKSIQYHADGGDVDVSSDLRRGGSVAIIGAEGAVELSSVLTFGIPEGGSVSIHDGTLGPAGPISIQDNINTSTSGFRAGDVVLHGQTVGVQGSILTYSEDDRGGDVTIFGSDAINIQAVTIVSSGGETGGDVDIRGPGTVQLQGIDADGMSVNTSAARAGKITVAVDGAVMILGGIDTSGDVSGGNVQLDGQSIEVQGSILAYGVGLAGGDVRLDGQIIDLNGSIQTHSDDGFSGGNVTILGSVGITLQGGTILTYSAREDGGDVEIRGPGSVLLQGVDADGISVNTSGVDSGGNVVLSVDGAVVLAGGIDASGRVIGAVNIAAGEDIFLGTLDMDLVGATLFTAGGSSFIERDLLSFDTTANTKLDSTGTIFYDSARSNNAYSGSTHLSID